MTKINITDSHQIPQLSAEERNIQEKKETQQTLISEGDVLDIREKDSLKKELQAITYTKTGALSMNDIEANKMGGGKTQNVFPDPSVIFPIPDNKNLCFLKNIITRPNIHVGDYTYYFDSEDVHNFEKNVVYHYEILEDTLIIGKFCQIGLGTKFIMNGGNHRYDGFSSYPFHAFPGICSNTPSSISLGIIKKDTLIGNDVWIGYNSTILPGISIGDGAIIGACSVVVKDVPPYTIIGGNPAREIRKRFDNTTIDFLQEIQWWNWSIEKITKHSEDLTTGNIEKLKLI